MKFCILMGSPRFHGNTAELLKPFCEQLEQQGSEVHVITLYGKDIRPCLGCYACQHIAGEYGCVQKDDVPDIMMEILASDCLVLATPIYTWYCTAPMKALLDRHYGLNKFYGRAPRESLWAGKKIAILTSHGYKADDATGPFETGIRRLCEHSGLQYMGLYSVRDLEGLPSFQTQAAVQGAKDFALSLLK